MEFSKIHLGLNFEIRAFFIVATLELITIDIDTEQQQNLSKRSKPTQLIEVLG